MDEHTRTHVHAEQVPTTLGHNYSKDCVALLSLAVLWQVSPHTVVLSSKQDERLREAVKVYSTWCAVWCGVVGCGVAACGVVVCSVVLCGVVLCSVVWCGGMRCGAMRCSVVWWCTVGGVWCGGVL